VSGDLLAAVVAASRRSATERERRARAPHEPPALTRASGAFVRALAAPGPNVIAECKRRSPSRGVLRQAYDPVALARSYASAGAAAISVLTEATFFDGSLDHLRAVRDAVRLPLLCKDFIVTDFQVQEAQAAGADAVLLIVAALDQPTLVRLMGRAQDVGVDALVEVHDAADLARALEAGATLVGVNSRDLRTLDVAPEVFDALAPAIPPGVTAVAESGLSSGAALGRLRGLGYRGFLIGERLVTQADPGRALADLIREAGSGR